MVEIKHLFFLMNLALKTLFKWYICEIKALVNFKTSYISYKNLLNDVITYDINQKM